MTGAEWLRTVWAPQMAAGAFGPAGYTRKRDRAYPVIPFDGEIMVRVQCKALDIEVPFSMSIHDFEKINFMVGVIRAARIALEDAIIKDLGLTCEFCEEPLFVTMRRGDERASFCKEHYCGAIEHKWVPLP